MLVVTGNRAKIELGSRRLGILETQKLTQLFKNPIPTSKVLGRKCSETNKHEFT